MKLRTNIQISKSNIEIPFPSRFFALGSCFAERMGSYLAKNKFPIQINPLGIAYHPLATLKHIDFIEGNIQPPDAQKGPHGQWLSLDLHSSMNAGDQDSFDKNLSVKLSQGKIDFIQSTYLILTWGTAWAYRHKASDVRVANCHKFPASDFSKELLTVEEIVEAHGQFFEKIANQKEVILTVSPIRHIKDTLTLNSVSKSTLRLAAHKLSEDYPHVHYFPSYEIMVDDLRDYRFYQEDLIHPSSMAEDYIWKNFTEWCFSQEALDWLNTWQKIYKQLQHRPLQENSSEYRRFLEKLLEQLEAILPDIDLSYEKAEIQSKLAKLI